MYMTFKSTLKKVNKNLNKSIELLETEIWNMSDQFNEKSEKWQESEKWEDFLNNMDELEELLNLFVCTLDANNQLLES